MLFKKIKTSKAMIAIPQGRCFRQRFSKSQRKGAVAVEFAMVFPLLLTIFLAGLEFTGLNHIRNSAINASYVAARHICVPGATAAEGTAKAQSYLNAVLAGKGVQIQSELTSEKVNVTVTIPVSNNAWGLTLFTRNMAITHRASLRRERE